MYPLITPPRRMKLQPDHSSVYIAEGTEIKSAHVNESAASILTLCNGENSVQDIVGQLAKKYSEREEKVSLFVTEFLENSVMAGTIRWIDRATLHDIVILGSVDYWTPDIIVIELTYNCPLSCKHCLLDAGRGATMNRRLLDNLSNEIIAIGVETVQLTGGEPLSYPGVGEVIRFFTRNNMRLFITTSGMISSSEIIDALVTIKDSGGWVQVSLDGFEEIHNSLRRHSHSYSRAVDFIKKLVSLGINVHVCTCVTSDSINELEGICQQVKEWGCRAHRIGVVSQRGRAIANGIDSSAILREQVRRKKIELKERYNSQGFDVTGMENDLSVVDRHGKTNCGFGSRALKVSPDGTVHACPMMNWPMGNLRHGPLLDSISHNSKRFAKIRPPSREICGSCPMLIFCNDCVAEALLYCRTVVECAWDKAEGVGLMLEKCKHYQSMPCD